MDSTSRDAAMRFEDEWSANEDCLDREAGSLGELLDRMKGTFSPLLFGRKELKELTARARRLPPTLAGFPSWLGFPIDDSPPAVCLEVSLLGGTRSAAFVEAAKLSAGRDPETVAAASLLEETGKKNSPLRRVVGDRVVLHYSIDKLRSEEVEVSALLYPVRPTLAGDDSGGCQKDFRLAFDAMATATGGEPHEAQRRHQERVYLAMGPDTRVGAIGASPARKGALRLTVLGFPGTEAAIAFLSRAGWRGRKATVVSALSRLEAYGAIAGMQLGVQFDVTSAGIRPPLELQIFSPATIFDDTGWFKDRDCWTGLIDGLLKEGLADPGKLREMNDWSFAAKPFLGRSGLFLLLQRIHHFAIVIDSKGWTRVNAHAFLLLSRWPRRGNGSG